MRKKILNNLIINLIIMFVAAAGITVQAQNRPYKVRDSQVQYILNRIETRTDNYKRQLNRALDRSRLDGTESEDMILEYITNFENATDALKQKFDANESVDADVSDVLTRASYINLFMSRNALNSSVQRYWSYVRSDLNTLARYYGITEDWTQIAVTGEKISTPYRVSDTQVKNLLANIETRTDIFKRVVNRSLDRSPLNGTESEDNVNEYITEFENYTDKLRQKFDARESVAEDVEQVLYRAYYINEFLNNNRLNNRTNQTWASLKADLNTLASYYNVSYAWTKPNIYPGNTNVVYRVPATTVQTTLNSIESRTDIFKREMNTALDRSILNNTKSEDAIFSYITSFENATDRLKQRFDAGKSTVEDVEDVLNRAYYINGFMRDYRLDRRAEREWNLLRADLINLRDYYNVTFDFDKRQYVPMSKFDEMLTGTYRLNTSLSDNVSEVVDRAVRYYPINQKARYEQNLERRLSSPNMLAIEKRGDNVTVASSNAPQVTFEADGITRNESTRRGQTIRVTARTYYDGVSVAYESDRANDFYVNFMPLDNGQLKVVRRVYLENKNETVTVASVYDKVDGTANFAKVIDGSQNTTPNAVFVVPNNTRMTAVLKTPISTEVSQNNDRFMLEVTSPSQFDGAIIEGRIVKAERSGRVTGKANLSLDFESIRLRNGQTYQFAGIVENIKALNGDDISITNEGTVKDDSQTKKTITRAGIGAALGALIGAIAGGGEGAAIGAAIGAGAGAGTVVLEGRDDINLQEGSEFTVMATAPRKTNEGRR